MNQKPDMMGPYDGLCLQTGNKQPWMKTPDETALVPNDALFTYYLVKVLLNLYSPITLH